MKENIKNKIQTILLVVFAVLLIISFVKIDDLSEQIDQMYDNINRNNEIMSSQIDSIYANVDSKLNEQASLFSEYTVKDGKFNPENNTADIVITLIPKTVTTDTEISATFDGKEIPFKRTGNSFSGTITVDAFKWYKDKPIANIKTAQETKTQVLDGVYAEYLYMNHLGSLNAHSTLSCSYSKYNINSAKEKAVTLNGFVSIYYTNQKLMDSTLKKAYIVTELNGKEIDRVDVTSKITYYSDYEITADVSYSTKFNAKNNDTFEVFAVTEDSYGYIHRYLVDSQQLTEDGSTGNFSSEELIYDKDGNLLNKQIFE